MKMMKKNIILEYWNIIMLVARSCVRQPRVNRTVWNTSMSIYAPNNMVQVFYF